MSLTITIIIVLIIIEVSIHLTDLMLGFADNTNQNCFQKGYTFSKINFVLEFYAGNKHRNFFTRFLYELFQKFRYLLLFKHSLKVFNKREIKVVNMMNDEIFKNFTISCNHAIGTT